MISDDVRYQVGAAASVNLDDPDPETARRTDGILSDQKKNKFGTWWQIFRV